MVTASLINRLSQAVEQLEKRSQQNRPLKVIKVRRGLKEDPDAAQARHFAAHPEDRDANVVLIQVCYDWELAAESQDCTAPRPMAIKDRGP